jgi:inward rectifier potassium channel
MPEAKDRHHAAKGRPLRRRRERMLRTRVGAFEVIKKGATRYDLRNPYYFAIALSWPQFALLFIGAEVVINVVFALLYLAQPGAINNARPGAFADVFFFSLETLATVGYGTMSPATFYGHALSAIEIICGVAFTAIMTGLTFVRFSRPHAKILYADTAVIATFNGRPTLMVRIGNGRASVLSEAAVQLGLLVGERTQEGQYFRRVHELELVRPRIPLFALTWTLLHVIDERSPLHGRDLERLADADIRLFLGVEAYDLTLGANVRDMHDYPAAKIVYGMRYVDAVSFDAEGRTLADLDMISEIEPDVGASFMAMRTV